MTIRYLARHNRAASAAARANHARVPELAESAQKGQLTAKLLKSHGIRKQALRGRASAVDGPQHALKSS